MRVTLQPGPVVAGQPPGEVVTTARCPGLPAPSESPAIGAGPNGGYVLRSVSAGEFSVRIPGLPPGAYLKSITMGRSDVLADGLRVTSGMTNSLEIVLAADSGFINGRVTDQ